MPLFRLREGFRTWVNSDVYRAMRRSGLRWAAFRPDRKHPYYVIGTRWRRGLRVEQVLLHRWIMQAVKGTRVFHRNGKTLDNRRSNLVLVRLSTYDEHHPQPKAPPS